MKLIWSSASAMPTSNAPTYPDALGSKAGRFLPSSKAKSRKPKTWIGCARSAMIFKSGFSPSSWIIGVTSRRRATPTSKKWRNDSDVARVLQVDGTAQQAWAAWRASAALQCTVIKSLNTVSADSTVDPSEQIFDYLFDRARCIDKFKAIGLNQCIELGQRPFFEQG